MLLFQWGTYDWGHGLWFQYGIVRQFILESDDGEQGDFWQLHLTHYYAPSATTAAFGRGSEWCEEPAGVPPFRVVLESVPASEFVIGTVASRSDMYFELV
jgi:hypothetical protein